MGEGLLFTLAAVMAAGIGYEFYNSGGDTVEGAITANQKRGNAAGVAGRSFCDPNVATNNLNSVHGTEVRMGATSTCGQGDRLYDGSPQAPAYLSPPFPGATCIGGEGDVKGQCKVNNGRIKFSIPMLLKGASSFFSSDGISAKVWAVGNGPNTSYTPDTFGSHTTPSDLAYYYNAGNWVDSKPGFIDASVNRNVNSNGDSVPNGSINNAIIFFGSDTKGQNPACGRTVASQRWKAAGYTPNAISYDAWTWNSANQLDWYGGKGNRSTVCGTTTSGSNNVFDSETFTLRGNDSIVWNPSNSNIVATITPAFYRTLDASKATLRNAKGKAVAINNSSKKAWASQQVCPLNIPCKLGPDGNCAVYKSVQTSTPSTLSCPNGVVACDATFLGASDLGTVGGPTQNGQSGIDAPSGTNNTVYFGTPTLNSYITPNVLQRQRDPQIMPAIKVWAQNYGFDAGLDNPQGPKDVGLYLKGNGFYDPDGTVLGGPTIYWDPTANLPANNSSVARSSWY